MAREIYVDLSNSVEAWRQKTNTLSGYVGDLDNLTTDNNTSIVGALNSVESKLIDDTRAKQLMSVVTVGAENYVTLSYDNTNGVFTHTIRALRQSDIPDLDAGKITTGTFPVAQIPPLPASKTTSGQFNPDRIPSLDASKVTTGIFDAARIPNLDASKITTGSIDVNRIPTIPFDKIDLGGGTVDPSSLPTNIVYTDNTQVISGEKTFGTVWINTKITVADNYSIMPLHTGTSYIGSSAYKFKEVWANNFRGTADTATTATKLATPRKINGTNFDGTSDITINSFFVSFGNNIPANAYSNIINGFDFSKNYVDVFPPTGRTMDDFIAAIVSPGLIYFNGKVNQDDKLIATFEKQSDRVRCWVQNSEQRAKPAINYFIVWKYF